MVIVRPRSYRPRDSLGKCEYCNRLVSGWPELVAINRAE